MFLNSVCTLLALSGGINLVRLHLDNMQEIATAAKDYNLDFDDAYQYVIATMYDLAIISFDSDFDRTKRGRKLPHHILQ